MPTITTLADITIGIEGGRAYVEAADPNPAAIEEVHALLAELGREPESDDPMDDDTTNDGRTRVWFRGSRQV